MVKVLLASRSGVLIAFLEIPQWPFAVPVIKLGERHFSWEPLLSRPDPRQEVFRETDLLVVEEVP